MANISVSFLMDHVQDQGRQLMTTAVEAQPELAMQWLDEGWLRACLSGGHTSNVRSFLMSLCWSKDALTASALLKKSLAGLDPVVAKDLLIGQWNGSNVVFQWSGFFIESLTLSEPADKANDIDIALLVAAKSWGVDFTEHFVYERSSGQKSSTLLSGYLQALSQASTELDHASELTPVRMAERSLDPADALGRLKTMVSLGMRVDKVCAETLMKFIDEEHFEPLIRFLTVHCAVKAADILAVTNIKKAMPERLAWLEAHAAKEAIELLVLRYGEPAASNDLRVKACR